MNNKQTPTTMQFEIGKSYYSNKACMVGLPSCDFTVVKRNEKTITMKIVDFRGRVTITRRTIMVNKEGVELVKYSGRATSLNVFADNR